jgi:hypothetical protein
MDSQRGFRLNNWGRFREEREPRKKSGEERMKQMRQGQTTVSVEGGCQVVFNGGGLGSFE